MQNMAEPRALAWQGAPGQLPGHLEEQARSAEWQECLHDDSGPFVLDFLPTANALVEPARLQREPTGTDVEGRVGHAPHPSPQVRRFPDPDLEALDPIVHAAVSLMQGHKYRRSPCPPSAVAGPDERYA